MNNTTQVHVSRREAVRLLGAGAALALTALGAGDEPAPGLPIVDTHQHLWDLELKRPPWLDGAAPVLRQSYGPAEYAEATRGLGVDRAIYMEVDVAPGQHLDEARGVIKLCREKLSPTRAAVIGGRPASADFPAYLKQFRETPEVKGVRQVLHGQTTPPGFCLSGEFVKGVQALGDAGLTFDLCLRPTELADGEALVLRCPGTKFILDHCGNADPSAFAKGEGGDKKPPHDPAEWARAIDRLAKQDRVICKISGIVAKARKGFTPDDLAPIVNHCLDSFGPDRVVFGGDWPVCLLGSTYRGWVEALRAIVSNRPAEERRKLWSENALTYYGIAV